MGLPIAAQVYSVREEAAADFEKTMRQLADMGYHGVELAGLYGTRATSSNLIRLSSRPSITAITFW